MRRSPIPAIRAILATIGGDDQITVRTASRRGSRSQRIPKSFIGYSDNTNLLNWLWSLGIPAYYGGSTQVHLGAGPGADDVHLASLRAALLTGGELEITDPGESEDFGPDWLDPRALVEYGDREPTEPWAWTGRRTHGRRLHVGWLHRSPRPARHRRQAALRRRASGRNLDPRNQRTARSRRLGQAMGS